ncbi:MAG: serine/threonine protein kinase [Proteobacteria bacterium]|nr:MAG: serine/threonine protein kinase [Pseudomonadota bacterium]
MKQSLKLSTKLTWTVIALISITVAVTILVTLYFGQNMAEQTIREKLNSSQLIENEFVTQKSRQLELVTLLVASDPAFVAYIAQSLFQLDDNSNQIDTSSIADLLRERQQQYGFDVALVATVDGQMVARSDQPTAPRRDLNDQPLMTKAIETLIPVSGFWHEGTEFYQSAVVPLARGSNLVGFLMTSTRIDNSLATDIKQLTGTDIAILHRQKNQVSVLAGTFNLNQKQHIKSNLKQQWPATEQSIQEQRIEERLYQSQLSVMAENQNLYYFNAVASDVILAPFNKTRNALLLVGAIMIIVAFIIAAWIVRTTLVPLRKISQASQLMAGGEYNAEFPQKVGADLAVLNSSIHTLANDIRGRESLAKHMVQLSKQSQQSIAPQLKKDLIAPGKVIGQRFQILQSIGVGGMGAVFKAKDQELDEVVALKVLKNRQQSKQAIDQLKDEIRMARRISHPNVVRIHDYGQIGDKVFISMEYVQGFTLDQIIKHAGKMRPYAARHAAIHICRGLAAAHKEGVIHRDLKPANIIIELDTSVKLMDFGIASVDNVIGQISKDLEIGGTIGYISPEQAQGHGVDERSDIYSLGILLMEMFVGKRPFYDKDLEQLMLKHVAEQPPEINDFWSDAPPALNELIRACLAKKPADRPQSVDQVAQQLKAIKFFS